MTADAAYGQDNCFRRMLETSGVGYVLAVPKSQFSLAGPRIDMVFEQAPDQAWERRSCGAGAEGQREYDWAAVQLRPVTEYDHHNGVLIRRRWALARRSLSRPDEIAYCLGYAPLDVGVDELVRVAEVIALTVAEVRRLLAAHAPRDPRARTHALSWSHWRRRRQAVARRCHYRRRGHSFEGLAGRTRP